jgi:hypothetical protein
LSHPKKQAACAKDSHDSGRRDAGRFSGRSEGYDMTTANRESDREPGGSASGRLGVGSWTILIVLALLLAGALVFAYLGLTVATGTDVPASGYVAMVFGVFVSLGVGFGLMALIFYSSRKGYDEVPVLILPDDGGTDTDVASESKKSAVVKSTSNAEEGVKGTLPELSQHSPMDTARS